MSGPAGTACCETFVEALGLKSLFATFMGKAAGAAAAKRQQKATQHEDVAHTLGVVASLLSNLASDAPARVRLLAKFVERTYEKVDKLLEIRDAAQGRLREVEHEIDAEKQVRVQSLWVYARLTSRAGARSGGRAD